MDARLNAFVAAAALLAGQALLQPAAAETQSVFFDHLTTSATAANPLGVDDTLFVDTLVTTETGPLSQTVTFTVAPGVSLFDGAAAWEVTTAAGAGPRLVGVNLDIFDAANTLVASDTFAGVLAGFAHSTFAGAIGPGTYTLVASGTGVRDSSLDVSLTFAVPEPATTGLMLAGLAAIGLLARRRSRARG